MEASALTSLPEASRNCARTFPTQENAPALMENEADCGLNITESFASYDRVTCSWRTWVPCCQAEIGRMN